MISIIIPTFKNKDLLIKNLRHNLRFFDGCEIIVVNDDPNQSLKNDLSEFKNIKLIENKRNLGFGGTVNFGVKEAMGNYVFLLNNDVLLKNNNFKQTIKLFEDNPKLFVVTFAQKEKNGEIVGRNKIFWSRGLLIHKKNNQIKSGINAWGEGGCSVFDKQKFFELGGFDELYSPFYWEDIDLSYRAWKAGYQVYFSSEVIVDHQHQSTIGKYFQENSIKKIAYRNQFIFMFKNITDRNLYLEFLIFLIPNIIFLLIKGEYVSIQALIEALAKLAMIKDIKNRQKKQNRLTDSQILNFFK